MTVFVLYGATGDLAKRMVLPAIYELFTRGLLPEQFRLIGNGRGDVSAEEFATHIRDSLVEFSSEPDYSDEIAREIDDEILRRVLRELDFEEATLDRDGG